MTTKQKNVRELAWQAVFQFERQQPRLDDLVRKIMAGHSLSDRDRRFLKQLSYGAVRHWLYLDWVAGRYYAKNYHKALDKLKSLLHLAIFELLFIDHIPDHATVNEYVELAKKKISASQAKVVNGILRNLIRRRHSIDPAGVIEDPAERIHITYSFPLWLVKRWIGFWGEAETETLCRALNQPPSFDLRVNTARITASDFKKELTEHQIEYTELDKDGSQLRVSDMQLIINQGWFEKGYCQVQDSSAALPVTALDPQPGETVLDSCAAPGGKYTQILQRMREQGRAIAMDVDLQRLKTVRRNVQQLGLSGGHYVVADARYLPFRKAFDRILVDAPCSGLGTIGKHPDIKYRRSMHEIIEFAHLQQAILTSAAGHLAEGGSLVYSTCTIDPFENQNVAKAFLNETGPLFRVIKSGRYLDADSDAEYLQSFPHRHNMDGSFSALFQKKQPNS